MCVFACAYLRACGYACMFVCEHVCVCVSACAFVCACVVFHGSSFCISCILWFSGKYLNNYALAQSGVNVSHVPPGWSKWFGLVGNR